MKKTVVLAVLIALLSVFLVGCGEFETEPEVDKFEGHEVLELSKGTTLEEKHSIEGFEFVTKYDTGDYDLGSWRITDSKFINMSAIVKNLPEGTTVLIEHVHIDMSIKADESEVDGMLQDSIDDSYHGTSQDGFFISEKYAYNNSFAVEGFSKDIIDGWGFICGDYGALNISSKRLTEENLITYGGAYANKMVVVYDVLIKNAGEEYYHTECIVDEFLIPVGANEKN